MLDTIGEEARLHDIAVSQISQLVMEQLQKDFPLLSFRYRTSVKKEEIKGNKEIAYILLKSKVPYFVDTDVKVEESTVSITSVIKESYTDFDYVKTLILEEKLRYLINLSEVYTGVENTNYTYNFDTTGALA